MTTFDLSYPRRPLARAFPLTLWLSVARHRAALAKLDAHRLADIGLTPDMAQTEARRPFWDVPAYWRA